MATALNDLPPGFVVDEDIAPPAGFVVDDDAPPSGFVLDESPAASGIAPASPVSLAAGAAQPDPAGNSAVGDFFRRIGSGIAVATGDAVAGGIKIQKDMNLPGVQLLNVAAKMGAPDVLSETQAFTRDVSDRAADDYQLDPSRDQNLASIVAGGIGSIIPTLASGPLAPLTGGAMMGENARKEAEEANGSALQENTAFYANAAVGALTEKLLGLPALLKSAAVKAIPVTTLRQIITRAANQAVKQSAREGAQEGLEQVMGNFIASDIAAYDPNRQITKGVKQAVIGGAIIGGPLGGGVQLATDIDARNNLPLTPGAAPQTTGEPPPIPTPDNVPVAAPDATTAIIAQEAADVGATLTAEAVIESAPKATELPPQSPPAPETAPAAPGIAASPDSLAQSATDETPTQPLSEPPAEAPTTTPAARNAGTPEPVGQSAAVSEPPPLPQGGTDTARVEDAELLMTKARRSGGFVVIPSAVIDKIAPETSTTPDAYRVGPVARGIRTWWLGKSGAMPKQIRTALGQNQQNISAIQSEGAMFGQDVKAAVDRVTKASKDKDAPRKLVSDVMEGIQPLSAIADFELREATRRARNFIDALSQTAIDKGAVSGDMADTFRSNMGQWMRRYYAAFDPEAGRTYDNVIRAAYADPLKRQGLKDARLASLLTEAEKEVRSNRQGMTDGEVEAVLRGLLDRDVLEPVILGGAAADKISKDVSSLIRRKEIPKAIRDWMGEERNPLLRFEKSINFMAQLISRHDAQKTIRDFGLKNGLFSQEKTGRFTKQMAEGSDTRDVLAGLYTTPEFAKALATLDPSFNGMQAQFGAIGRGLAMFSAEAKMAKVPLNPGSWVTNALGGLMMNLANGTATPFQPSKAKQLFSTAAQSMLSTRPMTEAQRGQVVNQQMRDLHTRLVRDGILNSSVTLQDFEASTAAFAGSVLETGPLADKAIGALRLGYYGAKLGGAIAGPQGAVAGGAIGAVTGGAIGGKMVRSGLQKLSGFTIGKADNFWKIVSYLDNLETYSRAFPNKPQDEVQRMAATVTLDTMPTYEKVPEGLRSLSKLGVIGSFINFNYEVARNTFNTVAIGTREAMSGNGVLQARGARRLAGVGAMIGLASGYAAKELSKILTGDDDEEKQKAVNRSFVPPWDKNNALVVTKLGDGQVSYINHGYLLPQEFLTQAVTAAQSGKTWEESVGNVFGTYVDDMLAAGVHIAPLIEATVNQKGFRSFLTEPTQGSQVTYRRGVSGFWERLAYVLDKTVTPGLVGEAEKIKKAVTGEEAEYGRKYTLDERAKRFLGLRENTYDLRQSLEFKMRDLQSEWRAVGNVERNVDRKNLPEKKAAADLQYVKEERAKLKERMKTIKDDAKTLGISGSISGAQKKAGVAVELR